jgi:hypothetical protein
MKFLVAFICTAVFFSCKKNAVDGAVELYLLQYSTMVPGKCQTDSATAILAGKPVVYNYDIKEYKQATFMFTLTDSAFQKIKTLAVRTPFAITVNKQVIYYGIYSPPVYSSTCDHSIGINTGTAAERKIQMVLGYPGIVSGTIAIDDRRNNAVLLNALRSQGKLR